MKKPDNLEHKIAHILAILSDADHLDKKGYIEAVNYLRALPRALTSQSAPACEGVDYKSMQDGDFLKSVGLDASKWADAFLQISTTIDHETMFAWFANAIEYTRVNASPKRDGVDVEALKVMCCNRLLGGRFGGRNAGKTLTIEVIGRVIDQLADQGYLQPQPRVEGEYEIDNSRFFPLILSKTERDEFGAPEVLCRPMGSTVEKTDQNALLILQAMSSAPQSGDDAKAGALEGYAVIYRDPDAQRTVRIETGYKSIDEAFSDAQTYTYAYSFEIIPMKDISLDCRHSAITTPVNPDASGKATSMQRLEVGKDQYGEPLFVMGSTNAIRALQGDMAEIKAALEKIGEWWWNDTDAEFPEKERLEALALINAKEGK